ncbi:hypothetical protein C8J56DRAFT_1160573 [Mycena floridula]|nr:hypothetical protein C8J56DRAFT_1160573 [Mycena floridula]
MPISLLLTFAEELLYKLVSFLDEPEDNEYKPYPKSLYHHVPREVYMLSLVSHQFRRICFPFLFSYIKCTDLALLEQDCLANISFAGCIRTLDVSVPDLAESDLVRLLPLLESFVWLELHGTELTPALLAAINEHSTLKTVAIRHLPQPLVKTALSLDKVLVHTNRRYANDILPIQQRHIRILCWSVRGFPLETRLLLRDLRQLHFDARSRDMDSFTLDWFQEFIGHHPNLTKITFTSVWKDCSMGKQHISTFLDALEPQSLRYDLSGFDITRALMKSNSDMRSGQWEVTGLTFSFGERPSHESLFKTLSLAGIMFPKVSSLGFYWQSVPIHVDTCVSLLSKHFPNLRTLWLGVSPRLLIWTPFLIPMPNLRSHNPVEVEEIVARMQWLAWYIFQAVPSLVDMSAVNAEFNGTYKPRRDFARSVVGMKMESEVTTRVGPHGVPRKFTSRGFIESSVDDM